MNKKRESERHRLRSGIPCVEHRCIQCCIATRMPLSRLDMSRILQLGHSLNDFATKTKEGWQLKNRAGRCIFLLEGGCEIYPYRPEGCRLYPLVCREGLGKAVLDHLCPHRCEFEVKTDDARKLISLLNRLETEKETQ